MITSVTLGAIAAFSFLVWDNLNGAAEMIEKSATGRRSGGHSAMPYHSVAIRIVSSYLQVAGLLLKFDLTLPASVRSLVVIEASSSSLSEQLILFDCATNVRDDAAMFLLKQIVSVWVIPCCGVVCCVVFWSVRAAARSSKLGSMMDKCVASLMVLFYTLFPSLVTRIALTFSCRGYGDRTLLSEALSVQCWRSPAHIKALFAVGVPGILLYVFIVPVGIAATLVRQRRKQALYPSQSRYAPRWTTRFGFMFAGYQEGYEFWESVVMLRKCAFVLMSIFLRQYGPAPQVVAASMILVAALSAQLQHSPYEDPTHDALESLGLHVCLVQLLVALMCNMIGRRDPNTTDSPLGSKSTALLVVVSFGSTLCFFWRAGLWTVHRSQGTKGIMGAAARRCGKLPCCGTRTQANAQKAKRTQTRTRGSTDQRRIGARLEGIGI